LWTECRSSRFVGTTRASYQLALHLFRCRSGGRRIEGPSHADQGVDECDELPQPFIEKLGKPFSKSVAEGVASPIRKLSSPESSTSRRPVELSRRASTSEATGVNSIADYRGRWHHLIPTFGLVMVSPFRRRSGRRRSQLISCNHALIF